MALLISERFKHTELGAGFHCAAGAFKDGGCFIKAEAVKELTHPEEIDVFHAGELLLREPVNGMTRKAVLHAAEFRALRDRIHFHGEVDKHGSRIGEGFQEHLCEASRIAADIGHALRRLRGPECANGFDRSGVGSVAVIMVEPEPRALRHGREFRQVRIDGLPGGVKSSKTRGLPSFRASSVRSSPGQQVSAVKKKLARVISS